MSPDADTLRRAGSRAVRFNAPMGVERADRIAEFLADSRSVVDLGCGRGEMLLHCLGESPATRGHGVDSDPDMIALARTAAASSALDDRVTFDVVDAVHQVTTLAGDTASGAGADSVIGVGVTHVFGSVPDMLSAIATTGAARAVVGAGIWESHPSDELREMFGHQPRGIIGMGMRATSAGWTVLDASRSTPEEWNGFEETWTAGVRAVGTDEASAYADQREALSARYRGVLGFGWLWLRR